MNSECSICQETITDAQNKIVLGSCQHSYHAICIQTWATFQKTCPLCRQNFADSDALQLSRALPALMALAVWQPVETQIQRLALTFAYVRLVLYNFPTSASYNQHKEKIIQFSETFTIDNYKLCLLCYSTRTDLLTQLKSLKQRFQSLTGVDLERHSAVRHWRQRILQDIRASMFFYQKTVLETPGPQYYQPVLPESRTS